MSIAAIGAIWLRLFLYPKIMKIYIYVVKPVTFISYVPLIQVKNFEQAEIVQNHLRKITPKMPTAIVSGGTKLYDVPHFSDYSWN